MASKVRVVGFPYLFMYKYLIMKRLLLLLTLFACLQSHAERVEPYQGSRIFWDTSTRKTIFGGAGYARIIQLQDGRLLAAAEQGGHIVISFSSNLGGTWTSAKQIAFPYFNINMCVPDLVQLADGTIIVGYNPRPAEPYTEDRKFGIRCRRSTDNGATWSDEIFINDASHTFHDGCWEPSFIELPSGEIHCYFADEGPYTYSGEQQISMCRSYDKGLTWEPAEKICFRAGSRDGMPVPIILQDGSEIVVAIEDNGWGYGDFFPTTVRCSLEKNWGAGDWVDAGSDRRHKTLDFNFCPHVTGGAPYLRQMPNGETLLSWQSKHESNGIEKMWVAVGDNKAKNFKALSVPFVTGPSERVLWNSVTAIDTVVYAIGGVNGNVELQKGYPKKQFEAALGTPAVDGKVTRNEGYYTPTSSQFRLGTQTGTAVLADFAYNRDSLYMSFRVSDRDQVTSGSYQDCIDVFIDAHNTSDEKPAVGTYRYRIRLTGDVLRYEGNGSRWVQKESEGTHVVVKQSAASYTMEAAVAWTDMGHDFAPANRMAIAVEVRNGSASGVVTEIIPDAHYTKPWTWVTLHLQDIETDIREVESDADNADIRVFVNGNQLSIQSGTAINDAFVYSLDGRCVARYSNVNNSFTTVVPVSGMAVMKFRLADGRTVSRKVIL